MTETITTCDRCHRRVDRGPVMLAVKPPGDPDFLDHDLCPGCHAELREWLASGRAEGDLARVATTEA